MYQFHYSEVLDESQNDARDRERQALDKSIELLRAAATAGTPSHEATEAVFFAQRLWTLLLEDLAQADNDLPRELKAQIISIGIWVLRECERLRNDEVTSFDDIIMISESIRDGVK